MNTVLIGRRIAASPNKGAGRDALAQRSVSGHRCNRLLAAIRPGYAKGRLGRRAKWEASEITCQPAGTGCQATLHWGT
jgi:hypothetical protein